MEIDIDGNGTKIQIDDARGAELKREHHIAMVNLVVQTTIAEINIKDKKRLVARMEKKFNGNNGNTCSHNEETPGWFRRLFKKRLSATHKN